MHDVEDNSRHAFVDEDESNPMEFGFEFEPLHQDKSTSTLTDNVVIALTFAQITRDCDVLTFTGLDGTDMFKAVFDYVQCKAANMTYWDGSKKTLQPKNVPHMHQPYRNTMQKLFDCFFQYPF